MLILIAFSLGCYMLAIYRIMSACYVCLTLSETNNQIKPTTAKLNNVNLVWF